MESKILSYAKLIVKAGVNIEEGDELYISCDVRHAKLCRALAKAAYGEGAKRVTAMYSDSSLAAERYINEDMKTLSDIPKWQVAQKGEIVSSKAAYIGVTGESPDALKNCSQQKIAAHLNALKRKSAAFYDATMRDEIRWCVCACATEEWAKKVYGRSGQKSRLEEDIYISCMADCVDPVESWLEKDRKLKEVCEFLNRSKFKSLKYENSLGTDFEVKLPDGYIFWGGSSMSGDGKRFFPNIPTEEVYTAPHACGGEGRLVSSMPLCHKGKIIEGIRIEFEKGRAVRFGAERGEEVLYSLLNTDEGARRLGELALVESGGRIQSRGKLFYNTLFDENAASHFALGRAYPTCIEGGEKMRDKELKDRGMNNSLIHVDFMVGTEDLCVTASDCFGKRRRIIENGKFSF